MVNMMRHILVSEEAKACLLRIKAAVMLRTESETVSYSDIITAFADVADTVEVVEWLLQRIVAKKKEDIIQRIKGETEQDAIKI